MKENSEALCTYPNPYLVRNENTSTNASRSANLKVGLKNRQKEDQRPKGISLGKVSSSLVNSFLNAWQKLIDCPQSFPESEDTPISTYVINDNNKEEEERMLSEVLCNILNLEAHSDLLKEAIKATNKIYHEDFPGSYIVEHNGERLGIFFLNIRSQGNGTSEVYYEFLPEVKSFKYLC